MLLGAAMALVVATTLIPSEAAVPYGSHVMLIMGWLLLTVCWLFRNWVDPAQAVRLGWPGALVGLFLVVHSVSALIMIRSGHGRPTLNALWVWLSLGATFYAVRQLVRTACQQRAVVSVLIALTVGIASYGIYQTWIIYPANRELYRVDPAAALQQAGESAPVGSPQRKHFEDRLASTEPTGTFALANSLAGLLVPIAVLMLAVAGPTARCWPGQLRLVGWIGILAALAVVLTCLVLTKSRSGYLGLLAGGVLLAVARAVPRSWLRGPVVAGGAAAALVLIVLVTQFGGLDRQVVTEAPKSLLYRLQYWQASTALIRAHPVWGCGPGNFKEYYTHYKLPEASESVADPHNFLVEVAATAGLPAATLLVLCVAATTLFVWRRATSSQQQPEPGQLAVEPWAVYGGAAAGPGAGLSGWAGRRPPARSGSTLDSAASRSGDVAGPAPMGSAWRLGSRAAADRLRGAVGPFAGGGRHQFSRRGATAVVWCGAGVKCGARTGKPVSGLRADPIVRRTNCRGWGRGGCAGIDRCCLPDVLPTGADQFELCQLRASHPPRTAFRGRHGRPRGRRGGSVVG